MSFRLERIERDAVAGIVAAILALFLHIVEESALLMIALALLALIFLRDLRQESANEELA